MALQALQYTKDAQAALTGAEAALTGAVEMIDAAGDPPTDDEVKAMVAWVEAHTRPLAEIAAELEAERSN
jgi:hypothetical protein